MMHTDSSETSASPDIAARLRAVRLRLPGQMLTERLEMARVCYGTLYDLDEIRRRVSETLPRRFGFVRGAVLERVEDYVEPIPDEALLKYDDAVRSELFSEFWVATPKYFEQRQIDPWILGRVTGSDRYAVVAQWGLERT